MKKYYPGIARHWKKGYLIFLVMRSDKGDSFVGYGIIEKFVNKSELSDEERRECERMGWRGAIIFSELYKFTPPLLIKETVLGGLRIKGKCWHGYPLTEKHAEEVLETAKKLCNIQKI